MWWEHVGGTLGPMAGNSKQAASKGRQVAKANRAERERMALELRKAGLSYSLIADKIGITTEGARLLTKRALQRHTEEPTQELRTLTVERYNTMLMTMWTRVQAGDEEAIRLALQIQREINTLTGLNRPVLNEHEVSHHVSGSVLVIDGDSDAYKKMLEQAISGTPSALPPPPRTEDGIMFEEDDVIIDAEIV